MDTDTPVKKPIKKPRTRKAHFGVIFEDRGQRVSASVEKGAVRFHFLGSKRERDPRPIPLVDIYCKHIGVAVQTEMFPNDFK